MNESIRIVRVIVGSARADGSAESGRVSFRLSGTPQQRWRELFEAGKHEGFVTEERGNEFLLHVECLPGEVAAKRDAAVNLLAQINERRTAELALQSKIATERNDKKRSVEDALNRELEALKFE